MRDIEEKKNKIMDRIGQTLSELDGTLGKMESTDSRLKGWFEQEKAIHEIHNAIREREQYDVAAGTWNSEVNEMEASEDRRMGKALVKIDRRLSLLDDALDKLEGCDTGRLKGWFEQRMAIHEIKGILHEIDKFEAFDKDEMDQYA